MEIGALRRFALELLRRQPATFADVVNGELAGSADQPHPPSPDPDNDTPEWCNCGHCIVMPTQEEMLHNSKTSMHLACRMYSTILLGILYPPLSRCVRVTKVSTVFGIMN